MPGDTVTHQEDCVYMCVCVCVLPVVDTGTNIFLQRSTLETQTFCMSESM